MGSDVELQPRSSSVVGHASIGGLSLVAALIAPAIGASRRGKSRKAFKYSSAWSDLAGRAPRACRRAGTRSLDGCLYTRANPRVNPMRLTATFHAPERARPIPPTPQPARRPRARRRTRAALVVGADPLARPAPPRADRRPPARSRRAFALPALRLPGQRRADRRYVDTLDFEHDEVFGIFNRRLELIAHGAPGPSRRATRCRGRAAASEFGVSVPAARRAAAASAGACSNTPCCTRATAACETIFIHALSENTAMLKLARDAGATVERDGSESEAWLKLPPDSFASHLDELLGDRAAELDYRLKEQARRPRARVAETDTCGTSETSGRCRAVVAACRVGDDFAGRSRTRDGRVSAVAR